MRKIWVYTRTTWIKGATQSNVFIGYTIINIYCALMRIVFRSVGREWFLPNCRTLSRRRQCHRVVKVVLEAVHSNNTRQSFVLVHDTEDKKTDLAEHY